MKGFKKMGELLGDQYASGSRMGFAKGGQVKQSPQFKQKTEKQDSMDHGVQPAKPDGDSQQQKEAGGTKRLKPGYRKGGKAVKKGGKKLTKADKHRELKKELGGQYTKKEAELIEKKSRKRKGKKKGGSC